MPPSDRTTTKALLGGRKCVQLSPVVIPLASALPFKNSSSTTKRLRTGLVLREKRTPATPFVRKMVATKRDYERLGGWAVMMNPDANIDRHGRLRTVPMQVLSLGASRTGTLSMQEALNILGYPAYHFSSVFANVKDADMWIEAIAAKFKGEGVFDWERGFDQLLGDFAAVTDSPCVLFWKELTETYPEAKVVLVQRDEDRWRKSFDVLLEGVLNPFATYVLRYTDPAWFGRINTCGTRWVEGFTGSADLAQAKRNAIKSYRAHYAGIRATIPRDKILEFDLADGWEPLCRFLGKDIPADPFPQRNEVAILERSFSAVIVKALKHSLFNIAIVVAICAILITCI